MSYMKLHFGFCLKSKEKGNSCYVFQVQCNSVKSGQARKSFSRMALWDQQRRSQTRLVGCSRCLDHSWTCWWQFWTIRALPKIVKLRNFWNILHSTVTLWVVWCFTQGSPQELRPIQYSTPESWSTPHPTIDKMWLIWTKSDFRQAEAAAVGPDKHTY